MLTGESQSKNKNNNIKIIDTMTPAQASLLGSGINAVGGLITNWFNRRNIQETNEQRYKIFREQMRYNDTSEQMKRVMASGLHPMVLSGAQPTDAPTSPDFESYEARNPFAGALDTGASVAAQMIQERQLGLTEAQIQVQELKTRVDALNAVTALMGEEATTEEALQMLDRIVGLPTFGDGATVMMHRDETLINALSNRIEQSNLSTEEKRVTVNWLNKLKRAEYDLLVSNRLQSDSVAALNKVKEDTERSIQSLNEDERNHIQQLTANLEEQWKSLNFQGQLDASKLKRVQEISDSLVKELVNSAEITANEAYYWVWQKLLENYNPASLGPIKVGPGAAQSALSYGITTPYK